ncbi:adenosine receptor A2b-like [Athalia rosae]|uniref:adenosine receptor A2b-like n=1 Tax=Athalia rosae TaxID=37344 RepID=UPI0020334FC0|nr:adenosine receptor A2b-like [Athalia rosae]
MEDPTTTELTNCSNYNVTDNYTTSEEATGHPFGSALNVPYATCEVLVAVSAVFGNGLVITVFARERRLRRRTNYYIISLATADLLVGLFAIPFAILASIGLPKNFHACLFTVSVLVVLCTISIFCLVAVSVDRYWAILHPMGYSRTVRTRTAIGIICVCWIAGTSVGFLPLMGWNAGKKSDEKCLFTEVMDYNYLVFLYFATIVFPALLIAAFYSHIYRVVVKQLQQIMTMNPGRRSENQTAGTMLRLLGAAQKREVKATQNLSRIVIFFILCWFPLYTINCVKAFCPDCEVSSFLLNFCIILSHLNSAGNPILYAYHLKDFRAALKYFICKFLVMRGVAEPSGVNVINGRHSALFRQNVNQTNAGGSLAAINARNFSLRASQAARIPSASVGIPPRGFGATKFTPDSSPTYVREVDAFIDESPSNGVSPDNSDRQTDEKLSHDNCSASGVSSAAMSPTLATPSHLELRTYKKLTHLNLENDGTSAESVFVIDPDVNHCVSSRERLTTSDKPLQHSPGEPQLFR